MREEWKGFQDGEWTQGIDVRNFIQNNYKAYTGDESFLVGPTEKTNRVLSRYEELIIEEGKKHVLDIDTKNMSGINNFEAGYISSDDDVIVGLQTDAPLKRMVNPYGGIRMVYEELKAYDYSLDPDVDKYFNQFRKTHNQGVFDAYTKEIRTARHVGLLTGLPDAYGRGRIIGDYRRIALYGIDYLMESKKNEWDNYFQSTGHMNDELIRIREEISMQYRALDEIKKMASKYGFDISRPAKNAKEAIQWTYFGYLAGVKESNGAAMSLGRVDAFFDIYINTKIKYKEFTKILVI